MKIKPDDPWYPCTKVDPHSLLDCCGPGVTIRLQLAAMAMQGFCANPATYHLPLHELLTMALTDADGLIDRANRDEGKPG